MSGTSNIGMQASRKVYPSGQGSEQCHFFRISPEFLFYTPQARSLSNVNVGKGTRQAYLRCVVHFDQPGIAIPLVNILMSHSLSI